MNTTTRRPGPSTPAPRVWAVILNWNGLDDTSLCIQSLQHTDYPSLSIVVVDNASPDGSGAALQARFPSIPMLLHTSNDGYSAGNNIGIRYALENGAEYVLVINNDVVADPGFMKPMIEIFESDPAVGIVTCKAFLSPGSDERNVTGGRFNRVRGAGVILPAELADTEWDAEFVSGSIFLCKREVFESVGLLDERFFMYFEDLEFSRRVGKRYRMVYTPRGVVYHKSGGGTGYHNFSPLYLYHMTRNRFWVFKDDPILYRMYIAGFSTALVCVKILLLCAQGLKGKPWSFVFARIRALWNGLIDGFRGEDSLPRAKRF